MGTDADLESALVAVLVFLEVLEEDEVALAA